MRSLLAITLLLLCVAPVIAADLSDSEIDQITNVITKLDSYVTWPEGKNLEGNGDLMVVTAIGSSPVYDKLKKFSGKETQEGRTFKFRVVDADWMPANSHVLIFSGLESEKTKKLIGLLNGKGSLCITLGEGNAGLGGTLNFVSVESHVRTELNLKVAKREGFEIAPDFFEVAKVIEE